MSLFKDNLAAVRSNPGLMVNVSMNELEAQLNGTGSYDVPDAMSPFAASLEIGCTTAAMAITENQALLRKQYASMALTADELYLHMSDDDYIGRFATPAMATFELYINRDEIMGKAVAFGDAGASKLVIPRLTEFTCAGYKFTMQYPVEIQVLSYGGIQVVYDATDASPIQTLSSNLVPLSTITSKTATLLMLKLPAYQFKIDTFTESLSSNALFDQSYTFTEQFYYARVYLQTETDNDWVEIKTTHTDQVYDPNTLTATLKVSNNTLRVAIPTVYNTQGVVSGEIRIDIYTTAGVIDVDLGSYSTVDIKFNTIDDDTVYTSPLNTFTQLQALCPDRVTGGSAALEFEALRDIVINNADGPNDTPITSAQISAKIKALGYGLVTDVNNLTKRQFLATKRLSNPTDANVISGAGCLMAQLQTSMEQISSSEHVMDNGSRVTIMPSQLYQYNNGRVSMMTDAATAKLRASSAEAIARATIENRYLYSPFHYVLDGTDSNFDVRPYYLDQPQITRKLFVGLNATTQLQASVDSYSIERITDGYRLTIKLTSSDLFKTVDDDLVVVQLGYQPIGENNYASINGTLLGLDDGERVYQFYLLTHYDIDSAGTLYTTNLSMYDAAQVDFGLSLTHDLAISVCVNDSITPGYQAGSMDLLVQAHLLNPKFMVVGRETLTTTFGYDLSDLWHRNRTILSSSSYQTWEADVPYLYEENVYKRDANGQVIIDINADGSLSYTLEHAKGEQVYDSQNQPVMRYLKGDVKLDANGDPILKEARKVVREFTVFMVDGLYYFATEASSVSYRDSIPLEIISWITSDIDAIDAQLLEKAELYVYPTTTFGDTTATVRESLSSSVTIDQSLNITYYMPEKSYNNASLRPPLTKSTKQLVNSMLGNTTISISDIIARLKTNGGDDITSIEVDGLGGENNYPIITIEDPAVKLSLRKKLTVLANNDLMVEDDININYLKHKART